MRSQVLAVMLVLAAVGAWLCFRDFDLGREQANNNPRHPLTATHLLNADASKRAADSIYIATFNARVLSHDVLKSGRIADTVADIVERFDVVALQSVSSHDHVAAIADVVNSRTKRNFDYVIGRRDGPATADSAHLAFLYDKRIVHIDREQMYMVRDPDNLLRHDPLVAWFRCRKPAPELCFTFSLVNVQIDSARREQELQLLADIMREVRNDGRDEDDVILLGDLANVPQAMSGPIGDLAGIQLAVTNTPTDTQATSQCDNLILQQPATDEFTGRSGVFDFMRQFNFSLAEALEISDRMPVWAEFWIYEGGSPSRVARRPASAEAF